MRFSDISSIECFIGSPKRLGSLFFVCLELRLIPDSSVLDSSENPCGGSKVVSFSEICWGFPRILSANRCTPLFSNWSAYFSHSNGAKLRLWNVSTMSSRGVWESIHFNFDRCFGFGVELD